MSIKITASFPKAVEFLNGLMPYAQQIAEAEMNADEGECWEGYAVVRLAASATSRASVTGELTPEVKITRIELMTDENADAAHAMLEATYRNRTQSGTLLDPAVVDDDDAPNASVHTIWKTTGSDSHQKGIRSAVARAATAWVPGDEAS